MTSDASWQNARVWRMRAAENRVLAGEMKEREPKAMMLRIADEYDRLAEWAEKDLARTTRDEVRGPDNWRIATNLCPKIASFQRRDLVLKGHGIGFRGHHGSKDRCPCPTNSLINARQHRRIAQPAVRSCDSLE